MIKIFSASLSVCILRPRGILILTTGILIIAAGCDLPAKKDSGADSDQIRFLLRNYQSAIEKLDTAGTAMMFAKDSKIYEQGGDEGNYSHYAAHHLAPELREFNSFKFSNYKVDVELNLPYAFTQETYNYLLELKDDSVPAYRHGAATSVLRKYDEGWKIIINHSSSHK
ncbi:MAG: nuclear transport factor 2 family protein [Chitinophagales bacterium]